MVEIIYRVFHFGYVETHKCEKSKTRSWDHVEALVVVAFEKIEQELVYFDGELFRKKMRTFGNIYDF